MFYPQKAHLTHLEFSLVFVVMRCTFHIRKVLPCILTISNHYPIWEKSPGLHLQVLTTEFLAACKSAHTLGSCMHFILKANKEDILQVLHNGEREKHIYSRTNDQTSDETEWGDYLRGAIFRDSSMHLQNYKRRGTHVCNRNQSKEVSFCSESHTDSWDSKSWGPNSILV